jgi:hypothetical protein
MDITLSPYLSCHVEGRVHVQIRALKSLSTEDEPSLESVQTEPNPNLRH